MGKAEKGVGEGAHGLDEEAPPSGTEQPAAPVTSSLIAMAELVAEDESPPTQLHPKSNFLPFFYLVNNNNNNL